MCIFSLYACNKYNYNIVPLIIILKDSMFYRLEILINYLPGNFCVAIKMCDNINHGSVTKISLSEGFKR